MAKISIVIPVYHNEASLPGLLEKLSALAESGSHDFEFIFVDDGSGDRSYSVLKKYAEEDARIKLIKLSRNFGSFVASLAGIRNAEGDCVAVISADLQDPPEMLNEMIKEWEAGYKVVLAVRKERRDPWMTRLTAFVFYRLIKSFGLKEMPEGGFDFFLVDRSVARLIASMEEKNSSLIGQVLWLGFKRKLLYYVRKEREHGVSMWTLSKKVKYFIDSFTGFSYFPLRLASLLGLIISFFGFLYILVIFYMYFFLVTPPTGWSALMVVILFTSGIQLLILGVLGEYLWRTLDASRKRPVYIIDETVRIDDPR